MIFVKREVVRPPVPREGIGEVEIGRAAGPTPAVVFVAVLVLDEEILLLRLVIDVVAVVALDVRVDDRHHFTALN